MSWEYTYSPYLWSPLLTAGLMVILGWYGWNRRYIRGAKPFVLVCLFALLWAIGSTMEAASAAFSAKVLWIKFQAIWHLPTGTALLYFVLEYGGFHRWLTWRNLFLLTTIPFLTLLLIITNDIHHLVWTEFRMGEYVIQSFGGANWVLIAYAFMLALATITVLIWLAIRFPRRRWPVTVMLFGQITGLAFYILDDIYTGLFNPGERVFLVLGTLSLSYAFALFRLHFFDPVPAARTVAIEQMSDGMLVLDQEGRIVDLNPAATKVFEGVPEPRGRLATEVFHLSKDLFVPDGLAMPPSEISLGEGDAARYYNVSLTLLKDKRGLTLGQLLLLRDVTGQKRAQARVFEQQSMVATLQERERLARELHDGVGQTLGYVGMQVQTARKWMQDGNIEKADSILNRLTEVARDAHTDIRESILSLNAGSGLEWSFVPTLSHYLESFQANYGIHTELFLSEKLGENSFTPTAEVHLLRVIQEAMTNARKHSAANTIKIAMERDENQAYITVTDDGSGFDAEKPIQSAGNHFGLVFMRERMVQVGGSLTIDSKQGVGTVVKLIVPVRD